MAKRDGGSSPVLWLIVGILAGILATVAVYLFLTRAPEDPGSVEPAPSVQMEPPPLPPEPVIPPVAAPPVVAPLPPPTPVPPTRQQSDEQVNADAAATGMTGPATPPADTAVNPAN